MLLFYYGCAQLVNTCTCAVLPLFLSTGNAAVCDDVMTIIWLCVMYAYYRLLAAIGMYIGCFEMHGCRQRRVGSRLDSISLEFSLALLMCLRINVLHLIKTKICLKD